MDKILRIVWQKPQEETECVAKQKGKFEKFEKIRKVHQYAYINTFTFTFTFKSCGLNKNGNMRINPTFTISENKRHRKPFIKRKLSADSLLVQWL